MDDISLSHTILEILNNNQHRFLDSSELTNIANKTHKGNAFINQNNVCSLLKVMFDSKKIVRKKVFREKEVFVYQVKK